MKEKFQSNRFDYLPEIETAHERGVRAATIGLELGRTAMLFSRVDRVPRYADGERESDVEHSYMLGLVAPEIVHALNLPLDTGLVAQFSLVHDLVELKTGDTPTFHLTKEQREYKEQEERRAVLELMQELPVYTARLLYDYEQQACPEARFVRFVDKLLPIIVDIIGAGEKVMQEDYDITSVEQLQQCHLKLQARVRDMFGDEFPDLQLAHQLLCELFEASVQSQSMMPERAQVA